MPLGAQLRDGLLLPPLLLLLHGVLLPLPAVRLLQLPLTALAPLL